MHSDRVTSTRQGKLYQLFQVDIPVPDGVTINVIEIGQDFTLLEFPSCVDASLRQVIAVCG